MFYTKHGKVPSTTMYYYYIKIVIVRYRVLIALMMYVKTLCCYRDTGKGWVCIWVGLRVG